MKTLMPASLALALALLCAPGSGAAAQKPFPPDRLYVLDATSHVVEFDADGAYVKQLDDHASAMAFGPDGLLYVADLGIDGVRALDGNGHVEKTFGVADITGPPLAMTFDADGELCVTVSSAESFIAVFDVRQQVLLRTLPTKIAFVSPLRLGPDGHLIASFSGFVTGNVAVLQLADFDVTGGQLVPLGPDVLAEVPSAVTFGPDGSQYFVSEDADHVTVRSSAGADTALIGVGAGLDQPHDLRFGPDGHLYVASFGSDRIEVIDTTGAHVATLGADSPLDGPTLLAFSPRRFHAKLSGKIVDKLGKSTKLKADAVASLSPGEALFSLAVDDDANDAKDFASLFGATLVFSGHQAAGSDPKTRRLSAACVLGDALDAGFGSADLTIKGKLEKDSERFVPSKASGPLLRAAAGHVFTGTLSTGKLIK